MAKRVSNPNRTGAVRHFQNTAPSIPQSSRPLLLLLLPSPPPTSPFSCFIAVGAHSDDNVPELILMPSFSTKTISAQQLGLPYAYCPHPHAFCPHHSQAVTAHQRWGLVSFHAFSSCCCCPQVQEGL